MVYSIGDKVIINNSPYRRLNGLSGVIIAKINQTDGLRYKVAVISGERVFCDSTVLKLYQHCTTWADIEAEFNYKPEVTE